MLRAPSHILSHESYEGTIIRENQMVPKTIIRENQMVPKTIVRENQMVPIVTSSVTHSVEITIMRENHMVPICYELRHTFCRDNYRAREPDGSDMLRAPSWLTVKQLVSFKISCLPAWGRLHCSGDDYLQRVHPGPVPQEQ